MNELSLLIISATLFVASNIDDLAILVTLFANEKYRPFEIVIGQYIGMAGLFVVAALAAAAAFIVPREFLGLLGLIPISLGIKEFYERYFQNKSSAVEIQMTAAPQYGTTGLVCSLTIANGGDNLSIYIPVFAQFNPEALAIVAIMFAIYTGLWCLLAYKIVKLTDLSVRVRSYLQHAMPFLLVLIGIYILMQTGALRLLSAPPRF